MWVLFYERKSLFTFMDKNVFAVVEDKDILGVQTTLAKMTGGTVYPLLEELDCLQNFVGNDYFAKHYVPMTPNTDMTVQREQLVRETPRASLFLDVELPSPCSNGR